MESQIISNVPFVNQVLSDYEKAEKFFDGLALAGVFGDKGANGYSLMMRALFGMERGLSLTESLTGVILYEDGNFGLYGDTAKAMIFRSGTMATWDEHETGSIEKEDYVFTLKSTRVTLNSNGTAAMERSFSVKDAKEAGLWISDEDVERHDNKRYSHWYAFRKRSIQYRALSYLSRDLYPDILKGAKIHEERLDVARLVSKGEQKLGEFTVKESSQRKSDRLAQSSEKAITRLEKEDFQDIRGSVRAIPASAPQQEIVPSSVEIPAEIPPRYDKIWSDIELRNIGTIDRLKRLCEERGIDYQRYPGTNSNKKLRTLIIKDQESADELNKHVRTKYSSYFENEPRFFLKDHAKADKIVICYQNPYSETEAIKQFVVPKHFDEQVLSDFDALSAIYKTISETLQAELTAAKVNITAFEDQLGEAVTAGPEGIAKFLAKTLKCIFDNGNPN